MSTYEPGTVAVATVRGEPNVRVMRSGSGWQSPDAWVSEKRVTDIRPLVVLDLPDGVVPHKMAEALRKYDFLWMADQIEAQTKPPRIPEPEWGAIVNAGVKEHDERLNWSPNNQGHWECQNPDEYARLWDELVDPIIVRPGIEDGAS